MRFRDLHAILVSAIMLAMAANAQGATFTRDSLAASFTTNQNRTVAFAAWGSDLSENEDWDRAEWFIDGSLVDDTTPMSGKTDYVFWTKTFDTQGVFEISARGVHIAPRLVGGSEFRTGRISWSVILNLNDPIVNRVSPDYSVTVEAGSWHTFVAQAREPGGE